MQGSKSAGCTRLISDGQVRQALSIRDLIPVMRQVFADVSAGRTRSLLRQSVFHPNGNILALMAATLPAYGMCGNKTAVFPGPAAAAAGTAQSLIQLFDTESGALRAVVSAEYITVARTAAATAAATAVLARPDASVLCMMGAGAQARAHAEAICAVLPIREIRVWSIIPDQTRAACEALRESCPNAEAVPVDQPEQAVRGADVVCTTTKAREPILFGEWLSPGAHVNAVGACGPIFREIDPSVLERSKVYVDTMDTAMSSAGDLLLAIKEGRFAQEDIVGEVGQVIGGQCPGRNEGDRETITLFETCGLAAQDVAAACEALRRTDSEAQFSF